MTHTTNPRVADPAPWFRAWPGVEQQLTLGLTSRELALWHTLRLKFWAAGCRPMSNAMIERVASMQDKMDGASAGSDWAPAVLVAERGLEELPGEGWVFSDLREQHAGTILAKVKLAESGRRGGQAKRSGKATDEGPTKTKPPTDAAAAVDPNDF